MRFWLFIIVSWQFEDSFWATVGNPTVWSSNCHHYEILVVYHCTGTVSQERSQPMFKYKRDFFAKILLSQPYMPENDSAPIICLGFWGFLTTHPGSKFPNQKIVYTHRIQSHYFVINPPQSALYTSTGVYINHYMAWYSPSDTYRGSKLPFYRKKHWWCTLEMFYFQKGEQNHAT